MVKTGAAWIIRLAAVKAVVSCGLSLREAVTSVDHVLMLDIKT